MFNQKPVVVWKILLIILLEGFVTISVEILTIRQLIPMVGNSVIVTSLIIGIFLLFLAYGYQSGGRQKGDLFACLQRNFLIAAIGIGFGLSILFIEYFFQISHIKFKIPLLWALTIYLCLIVSPIVYFLGQTVPITMNLFNQQQAAGVLGGKVLHLSTIGSFLGSVLTTLLLMNFLGVAWTVIINFLILFCLTLLCVNRKNVIAFSAIFIFLGLLILGINRGPEMGYFAATTPYANYAILANFKLISGKIGTAMSVNDSLSSFIDEKKAGLPYIERIKTILFHDLQLTGKDILVLGAGGFTLSAENTFGNRFIYVDIDPAIYAVAQRHFLPNTQGSFVAADARLYVQEHPTSYDVIISDTYSNKLTIPNHLLTREYFMGIKGALRSDGIAIFNIIGSSLLNTVYTKRIDNTLRMVFGSCTASPLAFAQKHSVNILYVCQKNSAESDTMIYDDDLNRSSLDFQ